MTISIYNSGSLSDRFEQPGAKQDGILKEETRHEKPESVLLSQLHFKLPAKFNARMDTPKYGETLRDT